MIMTATTEGVEKTPLLRTMQSELSQLSRSDGSASFSQGDTSMLAAVYGPAEVKVSKELLDRATVEVIYKPKVGMPGCAEKSQEQLIRNTCEAVILSALHPRTAISVVLQEMQNSGSLLACCLNTACLALLDASIPLRYMIAAVACVITEDGDIILDPTNKQEATATAHFTFVFDSINYSIVTSCAKGSFQEKQFQQCLLLCREAATEVMSLYRDTMKRKLSRIV